MKIVFFGGSGFLGSHVCDKLSDAGHDVTIVDLRPSPYLRPDQKMVTGSLLDEDLVYTVVSGADAVFDFAGLADIGESNQKPVETARINVLGNVILLEACRKGTPHVPMHKQVCIIPFRRDYLLKFNAMDECPLEIIESVDMMRILEHGEKVRMVPTDKRTLSVDTQEDLERVREMMKDDALRISYTK